MLRNWRRKWQPTPLFLPGESHGQRSLAGYSPEGRKELNMTEATQHSTAVYRMVERKRWVGNIRGGKVNEN